jgi:uncharacterized protein with FMN-binding domain
MDAEPNDKKKQVITGIIVLVVIAIVVGVISFGKDDQQTTTSSVTSSPTTSDTATTETNSNDTAASSGTYADGTYTATGGYNSPGGAQKINVSVTIKDGVVTDSSVTEGSSDGESQEYQERFISNYKSQVVGKKVDDINLSRVAGSSLTPIGFNNALDQIKDKAEA